MNGPTEALSGFAFEGRAAERTGRASRSFPPGDYHAAGRGARGEPVFAQTARGWRPVGHITERHGVKLLGKEANSRVHRLRRPEGYALETAVIGELRKRGVSLVEVHERDTGRTLRASIESFDAHGLRIARGGFAPQVVLPLARWSVEEKGQPALLEVGT